MHTFGPRSTPVPSFIELGSVVSEICRGTETLYQVLKNEKFPIFDQVPRAHFSTAEKTYTEVHTFGPSSTPVPSFIEIGSVVSEICRGTETPYQVLTDGRTDGWTDGHGQTRIQ